MLNTKTDLATSYLFELRANPNNPHDPEAIMVLVDGRQVGHIKKEQTALLRHLTGPNVNVFCVGHIRTFSKLGYNPSISIYLSDINPYFKNVNDILSCSFFTKLIHDALFNDQTASINPTIISDYATDFLGHLYFNTYFTHNSKMLHIEKKICLIAKIENCSHYSYSS